MKTITSILLSCFLFATAEILVAQDKTQLALDIAEAQQANTKNLMNYSWQRSSKVYMDGEEKLHQLVKVWFNSEGEMDGSVLSSESSVQKKRGVRGKMQQNKGEDLANLLAESVNLSLKYVFLSKGNWIDLMDKAEVNIEDGVVKIDAKDVLVQGDEVHYLIDESTKLFKSIALSSAVKDKPITATMDFKTMSDGTNHPDVTEIAIPSQSLKIKAENIDYIKQQ